MKSVNLAGAAVLYIVLSLAAPVAFCAVVQSGNAAGYLRVETTGGWTPLGSPFASADGAEGRAVCELVETNSVSKDAQIVTYADGSYHGYLYDGEKWQGMATAKREKLVSAGDAAADEVARGRGFWLKRDGAGAGGMVYMAGIAVAQAGSRTVVQGGDGLAEFTLAANCGYEAATVGELVENPAEGDRVMVPGGANTQDFVYTNGCWRVRVKKVVGSFAGKDVTQDVWEDAAAAKIAPGRGFWYIKKM